MLNLIGIGERAGSGVPDIYSVWEQQGWTEPEVEEQYAPDRTILKLSFLEKVAIKNGDNDINGDKKIGVKTKQQLARILSFMEIGKSYKTSDISDALGVKHSRTRKLLSILVSDNKIVAQGGNRNRHYVRR